MCCLVVFWNLGSVHYPSSDYDGSPCSELDSAAKRESNFLGGHSSQLHACILYLVVMFFEFFHCNLSRFNLSSDLSRILLLLVVIFAPCFYFFAVELSLGLCKSQQFIFEMMFTF